MRPNTISAAPLVTEIHADLNFAYVVHNHTVCLDYLFSLSAKNGHSAWLIIYCERMARFAFRPKILMTEMSTHTVHIWYVVNQLP